MHRQMVYLGAIPLETDLLSTNKNTMIGLAKLSAAVLGTTTQVNGLACTPNSPAALNVIVAPGEIYSLQNIDGTAYSSIAADTTHQIVKQGILLDAVTLSTPAPATAGFSINYLVQAAYLDNDALPAVLPYYNASNPAQAYSGPSNSGTTNNTVRQGQCNVTVKTGIAATTGTQTTPAADAGYTALYVVTVANGQTTVTSGNIATVANAPFVNSTLLGLAPAFLVSPTVPTPAQFDKTTKAASTAFVRSVGLQANGISVLTANTTLTAANAGGIIVANSATPFTITMPSAAALPSGAKIEFMNIGTGVVTLARAGSDQLAVNNAGATSLALGNGDNVIFASNGAESWYPAAGSAQLKYADAFASSLAPFGYQKFPGGLIIQWGSGISSDSADSTLTLPIAFQNQCITAVMISHSNFSYTFNLANKTTTALTIGGYNPTTGARTSVAFGYIAIGY